MIAVYVDTQTLSCPVAAPQPSNVSDYIDTLTMLQSLAEHRCVQLFVSAEAMSLLEQSGGLPPWHESELDHFVQRQDVQNLFYKLLAKIPPVQDAFGIRNILVERPLCLPSNHIDNRPGALIDDYFSCTAIIALALELEQIPQTSIPVISTVDTRMTVAISGNIVDIEPDNSVTLSVQLPVPYSESFDHTNCLIGIGDSLSPADLLTAGFVEDAIDLAVHQHPSYTKGDTWPSGTVGFVLHKDFIDSAKDLDFLADNSKALSLLRACAGVILNEGLMHTHALRVDSSGGSRQVRRSHDGAAAWRRDIDYEYHLHYWKLGGTIEFATVVTHKNFKIPE